jgi:bifunctional polynucleotide phosphatase/kinase
LAEIVPTQPSSLASSLLRGFPEYLYGSYLNPTTTHDKIAAFDLDDTLIRVKTKLKRGEKATSDNWQLCDGVKNKLTELNKSGFRIIIITNQKGVGKDEKDVDIWKKKLDNVTTELQLPIELYCSLYDDKYRKPRPTFWNIIKPDLSNSFFCGDAYCDKTCFASTDYKFALNGKVKFYSNTEMFHPNRISNREKWVLEYPIFDLLKTTEYKPYVHKPNGENKPELVFMVGLPASGKSTLSIGFKNPSGCAGAVGTISMNYTIINMDTLKTKARCIKEYKNAISKKQNILIDNTNLTVECRAEYIKLAINYYIHCVDIKYPEIFIDGKDKTIELFHHNMYYRNFTVGRPVIPDMVYYMMRKKYEAPEYNENIYNIVTINALEQFNTKELPADYFMYMY